MTLGRDFGSTVEVLRGLTGDESVVVNPPDSLTAGQAVRVASAADRGREAVKRVALALGLAGLTAACVQRPPYVAPAPVSPPPAAYKENADWKTAQPADVQIRGNWWDVYGDPQLSALEQQVDVSSQTLKQAQAQFLAARAAIGSAGRTSSRRSA